MRLIPALKAWFNQTFFGNGVKGITGVLLNEALTELADNISAINAIQYDTNGRIGIGTTAPVSKLQVVGRITATTSQNSSAGLGIQGFDNGTAGLQVLGGANLNVPFIEFHLPGVAIHMIGMDSDGLMKLRPWATSNVHELVASGYNDKVATNNNLSKKKLVMYDTIGNNNHQFYGFGVMASQLTYQVPTSSDTHTFLSGVDPTTSRLIMQMLGDGRVGIGAAPSANTALDVSMLGWSCFRNNAGGVLPGNGTGLNIGWNYSSGGAESTIAWGIVGFPTAYLNFCTWNGTALAEKMRLTTDGKLGIGATGPSSTLQVNGANGYSQFRLEKSYTPTGTGDTNGNVGDMAWDANYTYVKTAAGWKRSALSTF